MVEETWYSTADIAHEQFHGSELFRAVIFTPFSGPESGVSQGCEQKHGGLHVARLAASHVLYFRLRHWLTLTDPDWTLPRPIPRSRPLYSECTKYWKKGRECSVPVVRVVLLTCHQVRYARVFYRQSHLSTYLTFGTGPEYATPLPSEVDLKQDYQG